MPDFITNRPTIWGHRGAYSQLGSTGLLGRHCMHSYMHSCPHSYTTYIHVGYTQTYIMYAYKHACMYTCIYTYAHSYKHSCMHTCTHTLHIMPIYRHSQIMPTCVHTDMRACIHESILAYIHVRTLIHTCMGTDIFTCYCNLCWLSVMTPGRTIAYRSF